MRPLIIYARLILAQQHHRRLPAHHASARFHRLAPLSLLLHRWLAAFPTSSVTDFAAVAGAIAAQTHFRFMSDNCPLVPVQPPDLHG